MAEKKLKVDRNWVSLIDKTFRQTTKNYDLNRKFNEGDRIYHSFFGIGVVKKSGDNKINVAFAGGTKTLAQGLEEARK